MNRNNVIIRTSIIGIAANVLLAAFKAVVGVLSGSIAIILDAVNNLSDALSSLITIIGTKLASKAPDKKHPLGHGRIEYLSTMVIAVIILYAGITSLVESIKKIIHPETPNYTVTGLMIIAAAVAVKIVLGLYVQKKGREVNSDSLVASGSDAMFDSIISASTLVAAGIYILFHVSLEAFLGAVISIIIIKSGVEMLKDTVSEIVGERVESETAAKVKEAIFTFPEVRGAYDLVIHNYGPDKLVGSVHVEIPDTMTATEIDLLDRRIAQKVYLDTGVGMTGVSIYAVNTRDEKVKEMLTHVRAIAAEYPEVLQVHGFYADREKKLMYFDVVVGFEAKDRRAICNQIRERVQELYPDYTVYTQLDADLAD